MDWWANNVGMGWSDLMETIPHFFSRLSWDQMLLPVPEMGRTRYDSISAIGATGNFHFSKGDPTQNIKLIGNFCIVKNIISADIVYIPMEWFQTSACGEDRKEGLLHGL